jgi:hypothetical protein
MKIDCYPSPGCGSEEALRTNTTQALQQARVPGEVLFHRIDDGMAEALKLTGSPSVFIDGKELQPLASVGFS